MRNKPANGRLWVIQKNGEGVPPEGAKMRSPYGLEIVESCMNCLHHRDHLFCNLPAHAIEKLSAITSPSTYPRGATLFVEGQSPRGLFILCHGKVKLAASSSDGRTLILRIADVGEVLGLAAVVSGRPYQATAEVIEPTQTNFIGQHEFLHFLREHGEAALRVARQLAEDYHHSVMEMKTIGLSRSASEKLARFLLEWCAAKDGTEEEIRAKLTLTHEEIAQIIGASRETVTRLFSDFKKKQFLQVTGSTLIIRNRSGLESLLP